MKKNLARAKLLSGQVISGVSLLYPTPEIAERAILCDFDFIAFDWQHGPWSEPTLNVALALFTHVATTPIVRGPGPEATWIGKALDLGALGIIAPMVETAEQARAIVQAAKFPPLGCRSATGLRTAYLAGGSGKAYAESANPEILVVVMIETTTGVANVKEILTVPGVDCMLIGPYDLSRSLGAPTLNDAVVESTVQQLLDATRSAGAAAGYYTNYPAEARARVRQGFRMVFVGHDMVQLPDAFDAMKREAPTTPTTAP